MHPDGLVTYRGGCFLFKCGTRSFFASHDTGNAQRFTTTDMIRHGSGSRSFIFPSVVACSSRSPKKSRVHALMGTLEVCAKLRQKSEFGAISISLPYPRKKKQKKKRVVCASLRHRPLTTIAFIIQQNYAPF